MRLAREMPMSMPRVRPVARSAATVPICSSDVWRSAMVELGERKRDKPIPKQPRRRATVKGAVWVDNVVNKNSPAVQSTRPHVAMNFASILSASQPAIGAVIKAVTGIASITRPILELDSCRTRLR